MADKRFRDLTSTSSLNRQDIFAIEQSGNSRRISAVLIKNFVESFGLADHLADTTPHGITTYAMGLLANANLADLLADLGLVRTGDSSSGKIDFFGVFQVTWRSWTIGSNTTEAKAYGDGHTYSTAGMAWVEGDDSDGEDVSIWVTAHGTSNATVKNDGDSSASFKLFSMGW